MLSEFLDNDNGTANEEDIKEKLTPSSDVLGGLSPFILDESSEVKQETTMEEPTDLEGYLRVTKNSDTASQIWCNASEYPTVVAMQALPEDFDKYIEKVLEHSHKWKDLKDVNVT